MRSSESIDAVSAALAVAFKAFPVISKDKYNPFFKSNYADLASVREAVKPALVANDLVILQSPHANGKMVTVTTRILHKSGQWIEADFAAEAKDPSAQSVGAATTFICRYALVSLLGLSTADEDDDGNSTGSTRYEPGRPSNPDNIMHPERIFDMKTMEKELAAELQRRHVPEEKWEAIGKWLHGKDKQMIGKAITSV